MNLCEGYELVELTEDKIVQKRSFGPNGKGCIIMTGNPHPDLSERQKLIDEVAVILMCGAMKPGRDAPGVVG